MTSIELIQIHLAPAMLVIFRIGGLLIFAPVIGSDLVPIRVRVFLALLIGLATYPLVQPHLGDGVIPLTLWVLVPMIAAEILFGAALGFLANMPLVAAQTGGLLMGQQMGLGFAQFYNPGIDDEADVVGQMLFVLALIGFIMIGGVESMLLGILKSFEYIPLGGYAPDVGLIEVLCGLLLAAFEVALRIAAPLLALIFLETIAMGYVAKTVPQLNILSLGFPIRIMAGMFIVAAGLVVIDTVLMEAIDTMLDTIGLWIESQ